MRERLKQKWSSPTNDGTHGSWCAMRARCGGKGNNAHYYSDISVCAEWRDFDQFYKDMGARPPGLTLDRIDPSKGYAPGNCRWASRAEQVDNRRNTVRLTFGGRTLLLREWAAELSLPYYLLWNRVKAGHEAAEVLSATKLYNGPKKKAPI